MNTVVTDPVTMVYHELRSPLSLVATAARSAAEDCTDEQLRARCLSIVQAAERMLRTVGHLMVVAETSQSDDWSFFTPSRVLETVAANYRVMGASVSVEPHDALSLVATGSAGTFEALICSLIGNALDHSASGATVSISVELAEREARIVIINRPDSAKRHRGLGLGTYIAGKLAAELDASITTQRELDIFRAVIVLPVWPREIAAAS